MDSRNCQTPTASPAEPGGLPLTLELAGRFGQQCSGSLAKYGVSF